MKLVDFISLRVNNSKHIFTSFKHKGLIIVCSVVPFSWRVKSNTTNGLYKYQFAVNYPNRKDHDPNLLYPIDNIDYDYLRSSINKNTAKNLTEAVNLFIENF